MNISLRGKELLNLLSSEDLTDLPIRVADEVGELQVLSIYKSDCGSYIWIDVAGVVYNEAEIK